MDGPVYYQDEDWEQPSPVAKLVTYTFDSNLAGQISSASLTIRTRCAEIIWVKAVGGPERHMIFQEVAFHFDDLNEQPGFGTKLLLAIIWKDLISTKHGLVLK